jgi:hypothetical protein
VSRPHTRTRFEISFSGDEHSVLKIPAADPDNVAFDLVAVVDPVSRGAQKLGPILQVLQEVLNADIRVFLNSVEKNSDMPVKRLLINFRLFPHNHWLILVSIVLFWNQKYSLLKMANRVRAPLLVLTICQLHPY